MTQESKRESKEALKNFADYKNNYKGRSPDVNFNGTVVDGRVYNGFDKKTIFKEDAIFEIRWTDKNAKLYFHNMLLSETENKPFLSSDEYNFEFKDGKLEFTAFGSHWTFE